jgi:DNA repair exonuclease SbcCD ATPase subunit
MKLTFTKIHIHHFLSIDDAEVTLNDRGFCLVSGINKNPKDAARSNGSGKSSIWSAISYALTGETSQGLKSNLPNIYFNDGCWVTLWFSADNTQYEITRSKDDKERGTDLKIKVDGVDKSGKGIKESQVVLDQLLPDITGELIGSVIILGQGLPQRFSANTPSGRKEVLEHLSKSDFMIQDIKDRIAKRETKLDADMRTIEDSLVSLSSKQTVYSTQLEDAKTNLDKASAPVDFSTKIATAREKIAGYTSTINEYQTANDKTGKELEQANADFLALTSDKQKALDKIRAEHDDAIKDFNTDKMNLAIKDSALSTEIIKLKSITDICPTCHQHIPNVIKPDTTKQETELKQVKEEESSLEKDIADDAQAYSDGVKHVNDDFDNKITEKHDLVQRLNKIISDGTNCINTAFTLKSATELELTTLETKQKNHDDEIARLQGLVKQWTDSITETTKKQTDEENSKTSLQEHIDAISKMNTLVKRDFRGFLLTNVIKYIGDKAKEYSAKIFGTNEVEFKLDGNDIDIDFCGKDFDNLSGGEKQRVDLIIQFAIRDMMCKYLNFSSNILVLDEITDALDPVSCDKVLSFIVSSLSDIESVFIISHHADELAIPYDSGITVIKNEQGISEVR